MEGVSLGWGAEEGRSRAVGPAPVLTVHSPRYPFRFWPA